MCLFVPKRPATLATMLAAMLVAALTITVPSQPAQATLGVGSTADSSFALRQSVPDPGDFSGSHLDYIEDVLDFYIPEAPSGHQMWERTSNNGLEGNWLVETPDCWGPEFDGCDLSGGVDQLADAIEEDIGNAERWVDITSLYQCIGTCNPDTSGFPSGKMYEAIKAGLQQAANNHSDNETPIEVRIMMGSSVFRYLVSDDLYAALLLDDMDNRHRLRVTVATQTVPLPVVNSWNHAKIVAVDGKTAITGGQNLWSSDYESDHPVADVSMRLRGPAAISAHDVVDRLWQPFGCESGYTTPDRPGSECPTDHVAFSEVDAGDVDVLSVASRGEYAWLTDSPPYPSPSTSCFGNYNYDAQMIRANPDLLALWALIESAQETIFISAQQLTAALSACKAHRVDEHLYDLLAQKMEEGKRVRIIVSGADTDDDKLHYSGSTDTRLPDVTREFFGRVSPEVICKNLELAPLRHDDDAGDETWPGGLRIRNHAKVVSVDDKAFYIGSRNLYPAVLQEHGYIVEDATASAQMSAQYIRPIWDNSRSAAVVDPDRGICNIAQMRQQAAVNGFLYHRSTTEDGSWAAWEKLNDTSVGGKPPAQVYTQTEPAACSDTDSLTFCEPVRSFGAFNSFVHPDGMLVQQIVRNNTFFTRRQINTSSWKSFTELDDQAAVHAFRGTKSNATGEYPNQIAAFNVYVDPAIDNIRQELVMTESSGTQLIRERHRKPDRSWTDFTPIASNDAVYETTGGLITGFNTFEDPFNGRLTQQVVRTSSSGVDTVWSRDHNGSSWGVFVIDADGGIDDDEDGLDGVGSGGVQAFNFRMLPANK